MFTQRGSILDELQLLAAIVVYVSRNAACSPMQQPWCMRQGGVQKTLHTPPGGIVQVMSQGTICLANQAVAASKPMASESEQEEMWEKEEMMVI